MPDTAIVFTGGDPPGRAAVEDLPATAFVVAADSGLDHARQLGMRVDLAVGDFDSVDPGTLAAAERDGVRIERHPAAKDHTDLELAVDEAVRSGARQLIVVGGQGGRVDHWLGNLTVLTSSKYHRVRVEARAGRSRLFVVRDHVTFRGRAGDYVSLLAWNDAAEGITTEGLRWSLRGERLESGSSRGVSNELVGESATVTLRRGLLLVVLPGERSTLAERGEPLG